MPEISELAVTATRLAGGGEPPVKLVQTRVGVFAQNAQAFSAGPLLPLPSRSGLAMLLKALAGAGANRVATESDAAAGDRIDVARAPGGSVPVLP